jgi:hypothetical protein
MRFNSTTYWISVTTMILYMLYIMSAMGLVGLLLSLSGALIAAAFVDSFEIVTVSVVVVGIAYVFIMHNFFHREGFTTDGTPQEITGVVDAMNHATYGAGRSIDPRNVRDLTTVTGARRRGPTGVLASGVEGFANANDTDNKEQPVEQPGSSATATAQQDAQPAQSNPAPKKEAFTSNQAGLFKLGEMPSEAADGPHVDAGSTLMKAMNALKPEQINAMTADTKSLMETQQNLMGMLKSMQPILKDGRKLLDTFSGIFGQDGAPQGNTGGLTLGSASV